MEFECKFAVQDIAKSFGNMQEKVLTKATVSAINKTAQQAKTQAARAIRDAGYGLKVSDIKKAIEMKRAGPDRMIAVVKATGRPIGLIKYGARETKTGVSVQVKGTRKVVRGAFIATMPNGHTGVYERIGKGHAKVIKNGKASWHGLPIKELFGPSIPSAFINQLVQAALDSLVRDNFPKNFKRELNYLNLKK